MNRLLRQRALLQRPSMVLRRLASTEASQVIHEPMNANRAHELGKNDDRLIGDYPEIPKEYYHHRNPHIKYDDQQQKRNFDEPLYAYYDTVDVWSPDRFDQVSDNVALRNTGITIGLFAAFSTLVYLFSSHDERPAAARSYPHDGLYKALGATEEDKAEYQARVDSGN